MSAQSTLRRHPRHRRPRFSASLSLEDMVSLEALLTFRRAATAAALVAPVHPL